MLHVVGGLFDGPAGGLDLGSGFADLGDDAARGAIGALEADRIGRILVKFGDQLRSLPWDCDIQSDSGDEGGILQRQHGGICYGVAAQLLWLEAFAAG